MAYIDDELKKLIGATITEIHSNGPANLIDLKLEDGRVGRFYHDQDCCESVWLEETFGDLQDLVGSPILRAEEATNIPDDGKQPEYGFDCGGWTFYKLATIKGEVVLRFGGDSNGYYSTAVDFSLKAPPT